MALPHSLCQIHAIGVQARSVTLHNYTSYGFTLGLFCAEILYKEQ